MDISKQLQEVTPDSEEYIELLAKHLADTRKRKKGNKKKLEKDGAKHSRKENPKEDSNKEKSKDLETKKVENKKVESKKVQSKKVESKKEDRAKDACLTTQPKAVPVCESSCSDTSSDDSENEPTEEMSDADDNKGACLSSAVDFDPEKLALTRIDDQSFALSYDNDNRIFLKSGEYVGQVTTYESKYSHSILVKKGELVEKVRSKAEQLLGKKRKLSFFGKNDSVCSSFFPETVTNLEKKKCLNLVKDGVAELMPLSEFCKESGCLTVMLKAGKITKRQGTDFTWKMSVVEAQLQPIPEEYEGYYKIVDTPTVRFFETKK